MMFYAVQLITLRKKNDPSRRPLGFMMLLMLLYLVINASRYLGYSHIFEYLYIIQLPILLAVIPTYNLYLRAIMNAPDTFFARQPLIYYLPSFFILLLNVVAFVNMNTDQVNIFLSAESSLSTITDNAIRFAVLVFLLGNAGFITTQVFFTPFQYRRAIANLVITRKHDTAFAPHFQKSWSHIIVVAVIGFVVLNAVMNFLTPAYNQLLSAFFNVGILVSGGLAGYYSLKQNKLYLEVASVETEEIETGGNTDFPIRKKSEAENDHAETISNEEASNIISRLQHHLVSDKPYLNSKLSAIDLAREIDTSKQNLTYIINNVMDSNFYGIINKHRVMEAKRLLKLPKNQNYNLDVISQMVGFQSKSSFNGCFKKMTGQTPSEYRKIYGKNGIEN